MVLLFHRIMEACSVQSADDTALYFDGMFLGVKPSVSPTYLYKHMSSAFSMGLVEKNVVYWVQCQNYLIKYALRVL